jgi:hypothetical protein
MILTRDQIRSLAMIAGFPAKDIAIAVAVALAESGGNCQAYNPETAAHAAPGKGSYGLWQVFEELHPEFASDDLHNPFVNALAAYQVYTKAGGSFEPWSTFKNGAYKTHLEVEEAAGAGTAVKL